ncbi:MAG: hypothetical protein QM739_06955 [Propionivibrio sp.]
MLLPTALKAINHLLTGEAWALQRLQAFAGQTLSIGFGRLTLPLRIDTNGLVVEHKPSDAPVAESPPAVMITLPADTPARLILDRGSLLGSAHISGSAELAECLSFVFKNLRWDVEYDLARVVGDIAARRLVEGGKRFASWQSKQMTNLAGNLAEFFTTEQPTLVQRDEVAAFAGSVAITKDAVEDMEARIAELERPRG